MKEIANNRVEKKNGEYDKNQKLMETRQTPKPLQLEREKKTNKTERIQAALRLKHGGIEHELERMERYLMRNNTKPPEELKQWNDKNL